MLLPRVVDNTYRGQWPALGIFGLVVLLKTVIGVNSMWMGHTVATSADGIPVDSFGPAGAAAFVSIFAAWGLAQVILCALCWLVLIRYRALVRLMFVVLVVELLARKVLGYVFPITTTSSSGTIINLVLLMVMVIGLGLSLWPRRRVTIRGREA